ncbi:MAG: KPN_02809 family neutral zinc metallopeptidase [Luteolibacter sp.]
MQWKGRRESENVEDARGERSGGMGRGAGGGGGIGLLMTIGRVFGFKGILAAVVLGAVLWKMGIVDPSMLLGGGGPAIGETQQVEVSPQEKEQFDFVKVVMADTEDVWTKEFARIGRQYELPAMRVYRGQTRTACGTGNAAMGPFYCPGDRKIYIDLSFYDELAKTFKSPGDFAQAYVIAHEVGHHVQKLLGVSDKVAAMRGQPDYNEYSVRLELQADFLAGVWAKHNSEYLERGDIEEAMRAANAIGDDAIQKQMQGRVVPHSFTHGTSAQRMRWFKKGMDSGKIEDGDTFSMPYREL